tara:strand:- start:26 stop:394 length:369 start_codon:yes stop_codon:yes gene_type:complete
VELRKLIDDWQTLDDERLAANRAAKEATTLAEQSKVRLLAELGQNNLTGAGGSHCLVEVVNKVVPTVGDWALLYQFVVDNDAWDLLQKRIGFKAAQIRWDDGVDIPGITQTEIANLRRKKLS